MKAKIFHLITDLQLGGAEVALAKNVRALDNFEHIICSLGQKREIGKNLEESGFKVYELINGKKFYPSSITKLWKIMRQEKPDLVVTYLIHADVFGRLFAKWWCKKLVCYLRSELNDPKFANFFWFERVTSFLVNKYLAVSPSVKSVYEQKCHIKPDKITVIGNGVDLQKYIISKEVTLKYKKDLEINNNFPIIGSVSKLRIEKNFDDLIGAFQKISHLYPGARLLLIGDGPERDSLEKLSNELGIKKQVVFLGNRTDIPELLSVFDMFVLMSNFEGLSNALLEALASRLPIIASDIPANSEVVHNNINGYLVKPHDIGKIEEQILNLVKNKEYLNNYSKNSLRIAKQFSLEEIAQKLERFLRQILEE